MKRYEIKVELWYNIIQHNKYASYLLDYVGDSRKFPSTVFTLCTSENILFSGGHEVEEDKWAFQVTISAEALANKLKILRTCLQEHNLLWQKKHASNEKVIVATHQ